MYPFYENIKKEIDLQDLVQYLADPLNHLKLLQLKLEDYQKQKTTIVEIEELLRDSKKITEDLFPDLLRNYLNLSLEFRNKIIIKEVKNNEGETIKLTSKDLLLKNVAKLIEHIKLMEEKFYKHFSFDFLVNSRIISDLGYQDNYLDSHYESVNLKNEYVFSPQDAKEVLEKELNKNNSPLIPIITKEDHEPVQVAPVKTQTAAILQKPITKTEQEYQAFEKKETQETSTGGISLIELLLVTGFIALATVMTFTVYSKVQDKNRVNQEQQISQMNQVSKNNEYKPLVVPFENNQIDTAKVLQELAVKREQNAFVYREGIETPYKQTSILMSKVLDWKNLSNQNNIKNQEINYTNLLTSGLSLREGQVLASPRDMIFESKAYHIDVINNKAEIKVSNVFKDECQYMGVKFGTQYDIKVNEKEITTDNLKAVCELNNQVTILEK